MVKVFIHHTDVKLVLYELIFLKRRQSAVSGISRCLGQEGKRS